MSERISLRDWDAVCEAVASVFPDSLVQVDDTEIVFELSDETGLTLSRDGAVSGSMPLHSFEADDVAWIKPLDDALIVGTTAGNRDAIVAVDLDRSFWCGIRCSIGQIGRVKL